MAWGVLRLPGKIIFAVGSFTTKAVQNNVLGVPAEIISITYRTTAGSVQRVHFWNKEAPAVGTDKPDLKITGHIAADGHDRWEFPIPLKFNKMITTVVSQNKAGTTDPSASVDVGIVAREIESG